jgi:hypothetical protein
MAHLSLLGYSFLNARKTFVDVAHRKTEDRHGDEEIQPQQHAADTEQDDTYHRLVDKNPEQQKHQPNARNDRRQDDLHRLDRGQFALHLGQPHRPKVERGRMPCLQVEIRPEALL